jgi:hypothetical protein
MEFRQQDLVVPLRSLKPKCSVTARHRDGCDFHEWLSVRGSPDDGRYRHDSSGGLGDPLVWPSTTWLLTPIVQAVS